MLQAAIDESQRAVTGTARLKLYKGSVTVAGRKSARSLYNPEVATFEADCVYDQADAEGFIRLERAAAAHPGAGRRARSQRRLSRRGWRRASASPGKDASPRRRRRSSRASRPRSPSTSASRPTTSPARIAHCRMLVSLRHHSGCATASASSRAPRRHRARRSTRGTFAYETGDEDIHMAIERRLIEMIGPAGGQPAHRPQPQRPGRARPAALRPRRDRRHPDERSPPSRRRWCRWPARTPRVVMPGYTHLQRGAAGAVRAPPARLRRDARARRRALRRLPAARRRAAARRRRARRHDLPDRPRARRARARLRARQRQQPRRRLRPRLRRRVPRRGGDAIGAPLAPRRGARALVVDRVRLRRAARRVRDRQLDHAAEEEPGRRRAGARQDRPRLRQPGRRC